MRENRAAARALGSRGCRPRDTRCSVRRPRCFRSGRTWCHWTIEAPWVVVSQLASLSSEILPPARFFLLAKHGQQAFHVLTACSAVGHVREKRGVPIGHWVAAKDELAVLVHQLPRIVASRIRGTAAEQFLKIELDHDTGSPWPASINARRSFARAS